MKGLRTEAPPPGCARTSFSVGSKVLVLAPPSGHWNKPTFTSLEVKVCPVVMEACKDFVGPIVHPCLSLPQGSVTRSV